MKFTIVKEKKTYVCEINISDQNIINQILNEASKYKCKFNITINDNEVNLPEITGNNIEPLNNLIKEENLVQNLGNDLKEKNNRNLFVSIPGFAFHADISSNVCDIENLENEIDDWVVKWVEKYIPIEYNEIYKLQKISNLKKILMINHFLNIN